MFQNKDGISAQGIIGTGKYCIAMVQITIIEHMQNMDQDPFLGKTLGYHLALDRIYAEPRHIVWINAFR